jgi:hypothetical protein
LPRIFSLNGEKILDNVNFINKKIYENPKADEHFMPIEISDNIIEIAGWQINTIGTIYEKASPKEIIRNFDNTCKDLRITFKNFFEPFVLIDINNYKRRGDVDLNVLSEPCLLLYLRFCYWYGECIKDHNIEPKRKEIKNKIMPKNLLVKYIKNTEINDTVKGWYRETVNVIYELMSAGLSYHNGQEISFSSNHDFILNEIPVEVKTLSK